MEQHGSLATRHSLLERLKDWQDRDSWQQFFETYWRLIYNVALKAGLSETEAQEVVQETVIAVSRNISDFKCNPASGSFKGWLLRMTRWRIASQFRKRQDLDRLHTDHATAASTLESTQPLPAPDPAYFVDPDSVPIDMYWEDDWRQNLMRAAMERLRTSVAAKHFQVLDLVVTRRWPVGAVARAVGISAAQVYVIKFRVLQRLRAEIKRLEADLV